MEFLREKAGAAARAGDWTVWGIAESLIGRLTQAAQWKQFEAAIPRWFSSVNPLTGLYEAHAPFRGLQDPAAIPLLIETVARSGEPPSNPIPRGVAALALGDLGDSRAVQPLLDVLHAVKAGTDIHTGSPLCFCVVKALGRIRDPRVIQPLIDDVRDGLANMKARNRGQKPHRDSGASESILGLGRAKAKQAVPVLGEALRSSLREYASLALVAVGGEQAEKVAAAALTDGDPPVRFDAIRTLSRLATLEQVALEPKRIPPERIPTTPRQLTEATMAALAHMAEDPDEDKRVRLEAGAVVRRVERFWGARARERDR